MATRILSTNPLTPQQLSRFWAKVEVRESDECWPWQAGKLSCGPFKYGVFRMDPHTLLAHRVAFFIHHGWWPENVRHACDNPPCCNVAHLLAGTPADNVKDRDDRERRIIKLSRADADAIRQLTGESPRTIADLYGVSPSLITMIRRGTIWRERHDH